MKKLLFIIALSVGFLTNTVNAQTYTAPSNWNISNSNTLSPGGSTLIPIANKFGQFLSPEDFGAIGDGVTDDHTALQNLFTYAFTNGVSIKFNSDKIYLNNTAITVNTGPGQIVDVNLNNSSIVTTNGSNFLMFDGTSIKKLSGFDIHDGKFFDTNGTATIITVNNPKEFFGYFNSRIHSIISPNLDPRNPSGSVVAASSAALFYGQNVGHFKIYRNSGSYSGAFTTFTGTAAAAGTVGTDQYASDSDVYDNNIEGTGTSASIAVRIKDHVQGIFVHNNRFLIMGYGVLMLPADYTGSEGMEIVDNGFGVKYGIIWVQGGLNIICRNNSQAVSNVDASFIGYQLGSAANPSVYNTFTDNGANSLGSTTVTGAVYTLFVGDGSVVTGNQLSGIFHGPCMNITSGAGTITHTIISNNTCWNAGTITITGAWSGTNNVYGSAIGSNTTINVSSLPSLAVQGPIQPSSLNLYDYTTTPSTPASTATISSDTSHNIHLSDSTSSTTYGGQVLIQSYTKSDLLSKVTGTAGGLVLCTDCNSGNPELVIYTNSSWYPLSLGSAITN